LLQLSQRVFVRAGELLRAPGQPIAADRESDALFDHLRFGELIVPAGVDEVEILRAQYDRERTRSEFLLTILPTFGCNLGCPYCFMGRKGGALSRSGQDGIITFVRRFLADNEVPGMSVDWLGGEPLLALPTIQHLSEEFMGLCRDKGIPFKAQVITNGTLITGAAIDSLASCGVDRLQITLDGPREVHDRRRPWKVGPRSSFDDILAGLDRIVGRFLIRLRINVDRHNLHEAWSLLDLFEERGWLGADQQFFPYLSRVSPFTDACSSVLGDACDMDSFYKVQFRWIERLFELGVPVVFQGLYQYPQPRLYNCGAVGSNGFIFNAAGEVHKCGLTVDDSSQSVGSIGEVLDPGSPPFQKWSHFSPFDNPQCRRCAYLPTCLGGCPRDQIKDRSFQRQETCRYHQRFEDRLIALHVRLSRSASPAPSAL
jgi:uncharacterized protein